MWRENYKPIMAQGMRREEQKMCNYKSVNGGCVCPLTKKLFGELCRGGVSVTLVPDYGDDDSAHGKLVPEYRGVSIEGDYALILDNDDSPWYTLSVYTRDLKDLAYRVRCTSASACIYEVAEKYLKVRRKCGKIQYNYDGVWMDYVA